jgi:hypothetical protein
LYSSLQTTRTTEKKKSVQIVLIALKIRVSQFPFHFKGESGHFNAERNNCHPQHQMRIAFEWTYSPAKKHAALKCRKKKKTKKFSHHQRSAGA